MNDNLTKLNLRFERSKLTPDEIELKIELKIHEIECRGDENGRENLYHPSYHMILFDLIWS